MPTIEQVRAAATVARCGSFGSAAGELHRTQSAVSKAVADLERQIGFPIFDRSEYRPVVTAAGAAYLAAAEPLLKGYAELSVYAASLQAHAPQSLRLSVDSGVGRSIVCAALAPLAASVPRLRISIYSGTCEYPLEMVREGRVGIGISAVQPDEGEFERIRISEERFFCVARKDVTQRLQERSAKILPPPQIFVRDASTDEGELNELGGSERFTVDTYEMKLDLILAGVGWGRLPRRLIEGREELLPIKNIRAEDSVFEVWAARRHVRMSPNVVEAAWAQLRELSLHGNGRPSTGRLLPRQQLADGAGPIGADVGAS